MTYRHTTRSCVVPSICIAYTSHLQAIYAQLPAFLSSVLERLAWVSSIKTANQPSRVRFRRGDRRIFHPFAGLRAELLQYSFQAPRNACGSEAQLRAARSQARALATAAAPRPVVFFFSLQHQQGHAAHHLPASRVCCQPLAASGIHRHPAASSTTSRRQRGQRAIVGTDRRGTRAEKATLRRCEPALSWQRAHLHRHHRQQALKVNAIVHHRQRRSRPPDCRTPVHPSIHLSTYPARLIAAATSRRCSAARRCASAITHPSTSSIHPSERAVHHLTHHLRPSVRPSVHPSIHPSIHPSPAQLSPAQPSPAQPSHPSHLISSPAHELIPISPILTHSSVRPSIRPSVRPSVRPPIHPPTHSSILPSLHPAIRLISSHLISSHLISSSHGSPPGYHLISSAMASRLAITHPPHPSTNPPTQPPIHPTHPSPSAQPHTRPHAHAHAHALARELAVRRMCLTHTSAVISGLGNPS